MEPAKFDPTSHTLADDLKAELKKLVPEAFNEESVDFERLKTLLGEMTDQGQERYSFTWPGKTKAIRAAQTSSIGTLVPDKEASEDWDTTGNLYLEGDNLEILKLLQKSYTGKVKMIYIDPPYNTGKDFVYPDNYGEGLKTYLEYTGQVDGEGKKITTNTETDGRYHSKWLNMMYPRLMLARNLLKDDGVVFISIDDHEQANLKKICDEVFGADNLLGQMVWHARGRSKTPLSIDHEYILCYSRNKSNIVPVFDKAVLNGKKIANWYGETIERKYSNPDNDLRGVWRDAQHTVTAIKAHYTYSINKETGEVKNGEVINNSDWYGHPTWMYPPDTIRKLYIDNRLVFTKTGDGSQLTLKVKKFRTEEVPFTSLAGLIQRSEISSRNGTEELLGLFQGNVFEYPKPSELIKRMVAAATENDDIILDFFSGSASTAHAVMKLNAHDGGSRRFIVTQLQEPLDITKKEQKSAAEFLQSISKPTNVSELGKERIRRSGLKIKGDYADNLTSRDSSFDIGFRTYCLAASTFSTWDATSEDDLQAKLLNSTSLIKEGAKDEDVLAELILKSGYELTEVVQEVEVRGKMFYSVRDSELLVSLGNGLDESVIRGVADLAPKRFVARETGFSSDAVLTNTAQIMKDKSIDFRVL